MSENSALYSHNKARGRKNVRYDTHRPKTADTEAQSAPSKWESPDEQAGMNPITRRNCTNSTSRPGVFFQRQTPCSHTSLEAKANLEPVPREKAATMPV